MSGGSGSSKNVGRSLGVYLSPVNVKAPEPLMNSERAAMPLGVPRMSFFFFFFGFLEIYVQQVV